MPNVLQRARLTLSQYFFRFFVFAVVGAFVICWSYMAYLRHKGGDVHTAKPFADQMNLLEQLKPEYLEYERKLDKLNYAILKSVSAARKGDLLNEPNSFSDEVFVAELEGNAIERTLSPADQRRPSCAAMLECLADLIRARDLAQAAAYDRQTATAFNTKPGKNYESARQLLPRLIADAESKADEAQVQLRQHR